MKKEKWGEKMQKNIGNNSGWGDGGRTEKQNDLKLLNDR